MRILDPDIASDLGPLLWRRCPAAAPKADAAHGGEAKEDTIHG